MNQEKKEKLWIFITLFSILMAWIGLTTLFSALFLDFFPRLNDYKKWIQLSFILFGLFIFGFIYWRSEKKHPDKVSRDEDMKKTYRKYRWIVWKQNIFKHYPLNIIKLRFIPLFICWIISQFIDKKYKKNYQLDSFYFPESWTRYDYEEITRRFFKSIFRFHFLKEKGVVSYEVKFGRDFQNIEIRWTEEGNSSFWELKNGSYKQFFSEKDLKHVKIFTWIFPFGLYWNLIRVIKSLFYIGK